MHVDGHSALKRLKKDCEMNLGGTLLADGLVDPDALVAESPNLFINGATGGDRRTLTWFIQMPLSASAIGERRTG